MPQSDTNSTNAEQPQEEPLRAATAPDVDQSQSSQAQQPSRTGRTRSSGQTQSEQAQTTSPTPTSSGSSTSSSETFDDHVLSNLELLHRRLLTVERVFDATLTVLLRKAHVTQEEVQDEILRAENELRGVEEPNEGGQ